MLSGPEKIFLHRQDYFNFKKKYSCSKVGQKKIHERKLTTLFLSLTPPPNNFSNDLPLKCKSHDNLNCYCN